MLLERQHGPGRHRGREDERPIEPVAKRPPTPIARVAVALERGQRSVQHNDGSIKEQHTRERGECIGSKG